MLKFEKKKIHRRTFFGSVQLNDVSLNSISVVYSAKRYILYTGITVGTKDVKQGNAADHLRVMLSNRRRLACVSSYFSNLSYFFCLISSTLRA